MPFSRTATLDWILWDVPSGRAGKRPPAVLRLWARAKAIPGEARLALNRFLARCIRNYYLERVLAYFYRRQIPSAVTVLWAAAEGFTQARYRAGGY